MSTIKNNIVYNFKNNLCDLLETMKLYYNYHPAYNNVLDSLIKSLENLILYIYQNINDTNYNNECEIKLFALFLAFFKSKTNSTFEDLFLTIFQKFLNKITKFYSNENLIKLHFEKFLNYYLEIYKEIITKKYEFIGVQIEINYIMNVIKTLSNLINFFYKYNKDIYNKINPYTLFEYFLVNNYKLFTLSKSNFHINEFSKIFINTFKIFFKDCEFQNDNIKIIDTILKKIIEITKIKDDLSNNIDDSEQSFHVDTLLMCLKLLCNFIKIKTNINNLSYSIKLEIIKCLFELSYWDNPKVVNYTCKIFKILLETAFLEKNFEMKREIEKVYDFIFLRHLNQYYEQINEILKDNEINNNDILNNEEYLNIDYKNKITTLEIIVRNFIDLIYFEDKFLLLNYFSNDLLKIRFNILNETFKAFNKLLTLKNKHLEFLNKFIFQSYEILFNKIFIFYNENNSVEIEKYKNFENIINFWDNIIKYINEGNFKSIHKLISEKFNLPIYLGKKDKIENIPNETIHKFKEIGKSIAILIRYSNYIDISKLFQIIGENYPFSHIILDEYTKTFNFTGLDLLKAYELYVSTFNLTGEQHNIYNFICSFSKKYFNDNKNLTKEEKFYFKNENEVISFAYSVMILNTDLHNPNVTNHMTCEQFIENNIGEKVKLFENLPKEYLINIYESILKQGLSVAYPRNKNYLKNETIFRDFESLKYYTNLEENKQYKENSIYLSLNLDNINEINFPLLNLYNSYYYEEENINSFYSYLYIKLFDMISENILNLNQKIEFNEDKLIIKICKIAQKINNQNLIDKIIKSLVNKLKTNKSIKIYNLFFKICMNYSKDFQVKYLSEFYQAILDAILINLKSENNDLRNKYIQIIDIIINETYLAINSKRKSKNDHLDIINYFLFSNFNETNNLDLEEYKTQIYNKLGILINNINENENNSININNNKENNNQESLNINEILNLIKTEEEIFIFFISISASKIIEYKNKNEFYISLIFLKEVLNNVSEKNFIKTWPNLFQIFKTKMDFKEQNNNEMLFDYLYVNFFLHIIIVDYFTCIENEEYETLINNYLIISDYEVLFIVMENNDLLIKKCLENKKNLNDNIFEILVSLCLKLFNDLITALLNNSNNENTIKMLNKINKFLEIFINILLSLKFFENISNDCLNNLTKIIENLYDNEISKKMAQNHIKIDNIVNMINTLQFKLIPTLPEVSEEKWDLYLYLIQFTFKCSLIENEETQKSFIILIPTLFKEPKIPLVRFKQIIEILNNWYQPFCYIKNKYDKYWYTVFEIIYMILINNPEIKNTKKEIEDLWNLFIKKYLVSYVDEHKKKKENENEEVTKIIKKIYDLVKDIAKNNSSNGNEDVSWWDSTNNMIKLYFPNII